PSADREVRLDPARPQPWEEDRLSTATTVRLGRPTAPASTIASLLLPSSSSASPTSTYTRGAVSSRPGRPRASSPCATPTPIGRPCPSDPLAISTPDGGPRAPPRGIPAGEGGGGRDGPPGAIRPSRSSPATTRGRTPWPRAPRS